MLKTLKSGRKAYHGFQKAMAQKRSFLSEAYRCENQWHDRLKIPLLRKVNPDNMFLDLEHRQSTCGKVSAVDIDIFANTVVQKSQVEELLTLIYNLRLTAEASNILESTSHAVIRYLLDHNCTEELINVLHDRLNYGIFPDYVCYNILMDTFIERKDYASAAKIAVLPMLQEDCGNPITNALSVYSCHKYLEKPETWTKPPPPEEDDKEEIKVRVAYLRNPYFDDHFDLTDPRDLVGKTLVFYGKSMKNVLGRTCQLRGLMLYKKYKEVVQLIEQWLTEVNEAVVYADVFKLIEKDNEHMLKEDATAEFEAAMLFVKKLESANVCRDSLDTAVANEVQSAVERQASKDIAEQLEKYAAWEQQRQTVLNKQLEEIDRENRIKTINKMKEELEKKERLLTFFENEEQIELEIEEKQKQEQAEYERICRMPKGEKKLRKLEQAEGYIPAKL